MSLTINSVISIYIDGVQDTGGDQDTMVPFESYFTTEMSPMYTSVYEIRRIVGLYIDEIPDDIINQLIHTYSIIANDLAECSTDEKWERFAGTWVALKVSHILITNTEDFERAGDGKVFKQLGDMSVSRERATNVEAGIVKMLNHLECELYKFEHAVRTCLPPLMDCLGLSNWRARAYVPELAQLVEKGEKDPNKPFVGRTWGYHDRGTLSADQEILYKKRKYKTNSPLRTHYWYRKK